MIATPPLRLLDEELRLTLVAATEALAAAPGTLYETVYIGPLHSADLLRRVAADAADTFGVAMAEWPQPTMPPGVATLLLCRCSEVQAARRAVGDRGDVQVVAWGESPACELPEPLRAAVTRARDLTVDVRGDGRPRTASGWWGGTVERLAGDAGGTCNPLVVLSPGGSLRIAADQAQMHLHAAGAVPVELVPGRDRAYVPVRGQGVVVQLGPAGGTAVDLAALVVACRAAGAPLVIVAGESEWDALRADPAWTATVGACGVVRAGGHPPDAAPRGVSWPLVGDLWVGAPELPRRPGTEPLLLPEGTGLLEGLRHLEVQGRPGRLVAWGTDRVASVDVDHRSLGAVVVGVDIAGEGPCCDREGVLARLDEMRGWSALRLAVVTDDTPMVGSAAVEEPVQRVGFYFSRLDDERAGEPPGAASRGGLRLHAVAASLIRFGLTRPARTLLRRAERESRWGVDEEMLLGFLVAETDPDEAITRLRHAALRLATAGEAAESWAQQTDATLNALLLMVRTRQTQAIDAWATVEGWLRDAGTAWVSSARHAALLFELAARAGRLDDARSFAELFRRMGPAEGLAGALAPAVAAVLQRASS